MEKFVYKIENKINGKVYIGQTNNLKRRLQEHKHDKRNHHPIHEAIKKYGFDNFHVSTLYYGENYNEEEKKYIKLYKSNNKKYGYNIVDGGQDSSGENNPQSKLLQCTVDNIMDDLLNDKLSISEIANKYDTTIKSVRNINTGYAWRKNNLKYPLRKSTLPRLKKEQIGQIISLLRNDNKSIDEIAEMFKVKRYVILSINNGSTYKQDDEVYPIRELGMKKAEYNQIIELLKDETIPVKEIARKVGRHYSHIYRINRGEQLHDDSIKYPIRDTTIERNELGQYKCGNLLLMPMVDSQLSQTLFMESLVSM